MRSNARAQKQQKSQEQQKSQKQPKPQKQQHARKVTAIAAIVSVIAGAFVAGVSAQMASANSWTPTVSVESGDPSGAGKDFVLAEENVAFDVAVSNTSGGRQFNLSLMAVVPADVSFVSGGEFGAPTVFTEGQVLPNRSRTATTDLPSCTDLGLVAAPAGSTQPYLCAVPAGQQVWVWSNVNDLPQGGTVPATITIAPARDAYPVGSRIDFSIRAFTSDDPARLPTFDGSTSVSRTSDHTSGTGFADDDVPVKALRVTKSEPSAEDERLRGAHGTPTVYTVTVQNTKREATLGATVTDYLPAGIEYLGDGTTVDNSTPGGEYTTAPRLAGGAIDGETVETVQLTEAQAQALHLPGAGVYTKVTWQIGDLAANETRTLQYRAVVPLFANAAWAEGTAPSAESGAQAANLDNNTGASTRHGATDAPATAQTFRNVASVVGTYQGPVFGGDESLRASSDDDDEIIEAVDVRVLKSVDTSGLFTTGSVAVYSMQVDVSEYVDASDIVLTDVIPNGLCPALPAGATAATLMIDGATVTSERWNSEIPGEACNYPTTASGAVLSDELTVVSIDYDSAAGTFTVVFSADDLLAGESMTGRYSVMQRPNYSGPSGGTSSGDSFVNRVTVTAQTDPIDAIANDPNLSDRVGGALLISDDSAAIITSGLTGLTKTVLERGNDLTTDPEAWVKDAVQPFSPGDSVWYRIQVPFATGIDTRNPELVDYLPEGIELQEVRYAYTGFPEGASSTTPVAYGAPGFPTDYIPNPVTTESSLTWEFGSRNRGASEHRFMPAGSTVTVYIRGEVQAQSASREEVDSPKNQAKYQQVNVNGEISFRRDDAGIDLDWGSTLTKGIAAIDGVATADGSRFGARTETAQVVQGQEVEYRIDVTAPQNSTTDYVVWDVLPAGVKKADVGDFTAAIHAGGAETPAADVTAVAYDSGELPNGIALTPAYTGRSVIVWTVGASVPGTSPATTGENAAPEVVRGLSLGYTLTVPAGVANGGAAAQLTQSYLNTAGIVSYAIENTPSTTTTVVPQADAGGQQLTNRTPQTGEVAASDVDTVDIAEVHLPEVTVAKKLVSTEVGPTTGTPFGQTDLGASTRNSASQIVQGEYATFEYSMTIPARTSIRSAVLSDNGALRTGGASITYQYVPGSAKFFGPSGDEIETADEADGFRTAETSGAAHGVLTFPSTYTNETATAQTFRVQVSVWVKDRDANTANTTQPQIANGTQLTNTATLTFVDPNSSNANARLSRTANAQVQFIEPAPKLTKTASSATVAADGTVTYTLRAENGANRVSFYDSVVLDCVPTEITPSALTPAVGTARIIGDCAIGAGNVIQQGTGPGTLIEWTIPVINGTGPTGAPTLTYTGTVETQAGGGSSFVNRAELKGYTLPLAVGDDTDTSDRRGTVAATSAVTVRMPEASILKTVDRPSAPVGSVVTYTLTTTLPASTNFYDAVLTDALPAGVEYLPDGARTETANWASDPNVPNIGAPTLNDGKLTWSIGPDDILAWSETRTITVTFQARITDSVAAKSVRNSGTFAWSAVNGSTAPGDRKTPTSTVDVTLLNPEVTVAKSVKRTSAEDATYATSKNGNPDQSFTYRVTATNSGTSSAYGTVVEDVVPVGVRVDTRQAALSGSGFSFSNRADIEAGRGGTIRWTIAESIGNSGDNSRELVYIGTFATADGLRESGYKNTARVVEYTSAPTGGWTYVPGTGRVPGGTANIAASTSDATITPMFPRIELEKRASNGSQAFVGEAFGWTLQARNVGTGAAQTVTLTDTLPMNWRYDESVAPQVSIDGKIVTGRDELAISEEGGRQVLTWTIGSSTGAALLPGNAATEGQRTLLVEFSAKPLADAVVTAGAGLSVNHVNTLTGSATDTSGVTRNANGLYVDTAAQANAQIARADLKIVKQAIGGDAQGAWTAGDTVRGGYTQPQWRITVTNQGPDAANGPFRVTDDTDLPDGVTTGAFTARYYTGAADTVGTALSLAGTGTASDPFVVGTTGTTLKSDGTDRIVLVANVAIQAPATGTAENTAAVTGRTYELPADIAKDNEATATKPISSAADLAIEKTVNTAEVTAGRSITWSIRVRNNGPSVSASTTDEKITVTDTIPEGITGVLDPSAGLTAWTASASDGWPAMAGDTITWTFTGTQLAVGPAQDLSLTGTVLASWTPDDGDITNTATVAPGATTDPTESNNSDEVTVSPGDATTLAITKTRVVNDGGVWKDAAQFGGPLPDVVAGETISYRVVVTNNGPADARDVSVEDEVPSMLSFSSVADEKGTWTRVAGPGSHDTFTVDGTVPAASGDNTRAFVVTYTVDASLEPASVVENWAAASATNATNEPRDGDTTDSDRVADLSILKQSLDAEGVAVAAGETPEVTAGTQTRFLLTVTNEGPSYSSAPISIADRLPAGLTYVSSTISVAGAEASAAAPEVSENGRSIVWTALADDETLEVGSTVVIVVTADVAADVRPQTLVNEADVTGPDDFDPANNHSEADVDIVTLAEMTVQKDVVEGPWIAGTEVEYTITVDNEGPSVADAFLTDVLPAGLTPVSITGEGWTCDPAAQTCNRTGHPLGESTITVVALVESNVPTGTELTNTANLSWTDSRSTSPHSDSDDAVIDVTTDADLGLVKTAVDAEGAEITSAVAGESVRYRLEAENFGPSDAIGPITVTDALPAGIRFIGLTGDAVETWSAQADEVDPQTVTFTLLPEDAGLVTGAAAPAIEFEAAVDPTVAHDTVLTNTAVVSSGTPDSNPENDGDTADLTIVREADLSITKTHDAASVRIGDELAFALEVRNAGPSEATGVVVIDVVPAGLEVVTIAGDEVGTDWSIESVEPVDPEDASAGTRVVARYALPLAPGETASVLSVNTRVLVAAYSEVVNVADVSAIEITEEHPDRTPDDNRASDAVTVPPMSTLVVSKTAVGEFQVGKAGAYEIVVRNDGPTADPGPITVTDVLPAGLSFASSPDDGVQVDGQVVTWTVESGLAVDEKITLSLRVDIGEAAYPSVTNVVMVGSPSEQTEDAVLTDDATVDVKAADPLATTGAERAWGLFALALLMMVSGGLFVAARRRSSAGASVHAE
ncbi:isopeptide-forming domain-containing fimbrial protein [Microbacterium sp. NPDC008134]|uniref:isopeptide-forming domain-containing fimbrial protein n=1 Tax=Microbacterium sp. NPDC008134 TaxID=3364183 RepID=UPI0036E9141A